MEPKADHHESRMAEFRNRADDKGAKSTNWGVVIGGAAVLAAIFTILKLTVF